MLACVPTSHILILNNCAHEIVKEHNNLPSPSYPVHHSQVHSHTENPDGREVDPLRDVAEKLVVETFHLIRITTLAHSLSRLCQVMSYSTNIPFYIPYRRTLGSDRCSCRSIVSPAAGQ